jgi:hypothetical protein
MRYSTALLLLAAPLLAASAAATASGRFAFATPQEAAAILTARDAFILAMTPVDRAVRMRATVSPSEAEFIEFLSRQARPWEPAEIARLTPLVSEVEQKLARLVVTLPRQMKMVRTTDQVEGGAPHTRGEGIVLPDRALGLPIEAVRHVLFHELFHLIARSNSSLRDTLYRLIGFAPCESLELPAALAQRLVTNPDAPRSTHYIRVSIAGKKRDVVPLLVSKPDRKPDQKLFDAFDLRFLEVQRRATDCVLAGQAPPTLHPLALVTGFSEQVGRNTDYVIHPEEILADNFALLMTDSSNIRDPAIPESLERALMH